MEMWASGPEDRMSALPGLSIVIHGAKPIAMEMERAYYVVTLKPEYFELLRETSAGVTNTRDDIETGARVMVVAITQGGFGQDVVDDERQAKERFLEYLFFSSDLDLPRNAEVFDKYFSIEQAEEFVDLDEGN